jgi:hypothetical protein
LVPGVDVPPHRDWRRTEHCFEGGKKKARDVVLIGAEILQRFAEPR